MKGRNRDSEKGGEKEESRGEIAVSSIMHSRKTVDLAHSLKAR